MIPSVLDWLTVWSLSDIRSKNAGCSRSEQNARVGGEIHAGKVGVMRDIQIISEATCLEVIASYEHR